MSVAVIEAFQNWCLRASLWCYEYAGREAPSVIPKTMDEIYSQFPKLLGSDVLPPAQETCPGRIEPISFPEEFANRVANLENFTLPAQRGRAIPLVTMGACLDPIIEDGDLTLTDPRGVVRDGDLVLVSWCDDVDQTKLLDCDLYEADFGQRAPPIMVKFIYSTGGQYWLADRELGFPLPESFRVLGVICDVKRNGRSIYRKENV